MISKDSRFVEDVLSMIGVEPVLLRDLVGGLRGSYFSSLSPASGRTWRGVRPDEVEDVLRASGAFLACREHGAGIAIYVATEPFGEVWYRRGYVPVRLY